MATPLENLNKANDDYHEAVDAIFRMDIDDFTCNCCKNEADAAVVKAIFGANTNMIFKLMTKAQEQVTPHIGGLTTWLNRHRP